MEKLSKNKAGNSFQEYPIAWILIVIGICGMFLLTTRNFQVKPNLHAEKPITIADENQYSPHQAHFDTANTMAVNSNDQAEKIVSNSVKKPAESVNIPAVKLFHEKVATDKFSTKFGQIESMKPLDTLQQLTPIHEIQPHTIPAE